ncbi:hypothetical protein CEF21_05850 [Bacillus sp. FJAT-42376]|uniref:hypothetical protein n=1 Tax=Bacillus sp. FJAT-42376 TaxID=2014076 RepID=UPI000F50D2BD|nr:hypothetical protein [Bacillus sp. FJAT-42376]AZB41865.1 hypothetical protein CEF21_05850 [Bacillus sp. FJAT-42376]
MARKFTITGLAILFIAFIGYLTYQTFFRMTSLQGTSQSGKWAAEYHENDVYWETKIIKLKNTDDQLTKVNFIDNGDVDEYSGFSREEWMKDRNGRSYITINVLADAPEENHSYQVQIHWLENEKEYEETITLK